MQQMQPTEGGAPVQIEQINILFFFFSFKKITIKPVGNLILIHQKLFQTLFTDDPIKK